MARQHMATRAVREVPAQTISLTQDELADLIGQVIQKYLPGFLAASEKRIMSHMTRKLGGLCSRHGHRPGPSLTAEHLDDLRRVHEFVRQDYAIHRACEIVHAENAARDDRHLHYASVASLRDAYAKRFRQQD